jgi:hypothetical protein
MRGGTGAAMFWPMTEQSTTRPARFSRGWCAAIACAAALLGHPLAAQNLRGTVRDSVGHQAVAGAVVMLLDSSGVVLARRITDEAGRYQIAVPASARWLRFVRIGFQPRELRVPASSGAITSFDIAMLPVSTMLATVRVRDQSKCSRRDDRAAALGLWEQVRAGLLATIVARETNGASVHLLEFVRTMDGNSDHITRFTVRADSAVGVGKSFETARSAKDFVASGFAADSGGDQTLFGPDAEVLLDEAFAAAYCFRLAVPNLMRPNEVGLAFAPAAAQKDRIDIDGTLWVDTATRSLKNIAYRYVGLPGRADEYRPGGLISFRQMANGSVMIDRWFIRGVSAALDTAYRNGRQHQRAFLFAAETGGELASASWPDGKSWHASLGTLHVHAITSSGQPAEGATIALQGTHYRATIDSSGDAVIPDLVPGPYSVEIIDRRLASIGIWIPTRVKFVATRDATSQATIKVPTAEEWVSSQCIDAHQWDVGDSVFVIGRVLTPAGDPVADAKVTFSVQSKPGLWRLLDNFYTTGTDGVFHSCDKSYVVGTGVKIRVLREEMPPTEGVQPLTSNLTLMMLRVLPIPK